MYFDRLVTRVLTQSCRRSLVRARGGAPYLHQQGIVHFDTSPKIFCCRSILATLVAMQRVRRRPGGSSSSGFGFVRAGLGSGSSPQVGTAAMAGESTLLTDFGGTFLLSAPVDERIAKTNTVGRRLHAAEALVPEKERGRGAAAGVWVLR